ncbi:MAG: SEC-C metal-binding domain-containing protein [Dehalococcoidia bacterium]|nr:SEC-C metal-binding domain-containing protein [Dehalococcoidia bacterium]
MKKVGRNEPCPCGSGKKYKKCCGVTGDSKVTIRRDPDYFEINRDIAYRGRIGQMRKKYSILFIEAKKKNISTLEEAQAKAAVERNQVISCQKGCHYCCSAYVEATLQECEAIVYHLYENSEILKAFLGKYPKWREDVRKNGDLYKQCGRFWKMKITPENARNLKKQCDDENQKYYEQNICCPFLNQDLCSIYKVRPYMCVALTSVSPQEYCRPNSSNEPVTIKALSQDLLLDCSFYYGKLESPVVTFMPITVYEILKSGTFFFSQGRIPGLEKLDEEFCRDPEVLSTLKKYGVLD